MKGWLLPLLAAIVGVIWYARRRRDNVVSAAWCRQQDQRDQRRGIDGVTIVFPIQKALNENGWWNAAKYRRRA